MSVPGFKLGREKELKNIRKHIPKQEGKGSVNMITGRLFSIEGAGGENSASVPFLSKNYLGST
ncbi:MAG: hypothetical protein GY940_02905 [bacterium]|nr:hypothetical protein [bacterium]